MMKQNLKQPKLTGGTSTHRNNLVMSLLRTFLFLAVMAIGTGSAWGQTSLGKFAFSTTTFQPVNNDTYTFGEDLYVLDDRNALKFYAQGLKDDKKDYVYQTYGGIPHFKLQNDDKKYHFKIQFAKGTVVPGDILKVSCARAYYGSDKSLLGYKIDDGSTGTTVQTDEEKTYADGAFVLEHTLTADEIITDGDNQYVRIYRLNSGCGYGSFEIVRPGVNVKVNLSFLNDSFNGTGEKQNVSGEGLTNAKISWSNIVNETMEVGGNKYYKFNDDNAYIKIWPYYPGNELCFVAGDVVTVHMSTTESDVDGGFCIKNSKYAADSWQKITPNVDYAKSYTLKAEDINADGSITLYRLAWGSNLKYYSFEVFYTSKYTLTWDASQVPANCDAWFTIGSDETQHRESVSNIPSGTSVTFHGSDSDNDHKIINGWDNPGGSYWGWGPTKTVTVESDISVKPDFRNCLRVFVESGEGGTATVSGGNGKKYFQNASPTYTATPNDGYTFVGWYNGDTKVSGDNPYTAEFAGTSDNTLRAKFEPTVKPFEVSCDWGNSHIQVLAPTSANANIAPFSVRAGGQLVDKSNYTLSYAVKSGPISVTAEGKITVDSENTSVEGLTDGYKGPVDAYITITANPNNASYTAGSVDLHVQIKAVTNGIVKLNPSEVRIGDYFDVTIERGTGFPDIKYYWTFPANTTNVYGYNGDAIVQTETTRDGVAIPYQFLATGATSGKMDIYVRIESPNTATEYKGLWGSGVTIKPITIPTIDQEGSDIIINYEEDFVNRKDEEVDAFLEYWIGEKIDANKHQTGFGNNASTFKLENQPAGTVITAKSVVRFKKPDNLEELVYVSSDEVTYTVRKPFQAITVNGTERQYDLYVPEEITSAGTVGVVISLHNGGEDVSEGNLGRVYFNDVADANKNDNDKKFVVVSPRALIRDGVRDWQLDESSTDDTEFFKAIVKDINDRDNGLTVDYDRIYLAGYGTGGAMAFKVAHKDADFYSAIASVSGVPYDNSHLWHTGKKPVPFLFIQGANDGVFRDQIRNDNVTVIAHNMMYRNGAAFANSNGNLSIAGTNESIIYDCHEAEAGGAAFYHYTIPNMYHSSENNWDGTDGDDVAPTMWAFFNKADKVNSVDETLKFRVNDPSKFWDNASNYGFVKGAADSKDVLSYGGATKTNENQNIYHSLQFNGGINGAAHFLKLNVETEDVHGAENEVPTDYFLVKLTKTGDTTPVFAKRYQAGRGKKDLYINFVALPGFNEYKLEVTKSRKDLVVKVHGMEFYSGRCEDKSQEENPVFFFDVEKVLTGMNPIYQPVFDKSYDGIAKEFLPIADIPVGVIPVDDPKHPSDIPTSDYRVIIGDAALTSLPSTVIAEDGWTNSAGRYTATITGNTLFNIAKSGKTGEDEGIKSRNAFIFDKNREGYTIDRFKGLCISEHGRAEMPEYLNGTRGAFPDHGVIAIKLQGTLDFYLLAQNEVTYDGTDPNPARRTLKVYYTNDQLDGELKELEEWWFFGTRSENGYNDKNGQSLAALSAGVRLPQLGQDGTCTVFITYEGREKGAGPFTHDANDADKIWIKGFVIKRPDLKVTIGRTDSKYSSQEYKGENNTTCTRFGENKPYVWSFENVGFNNTKKADITQKKINKKDGRTYVCGGTDDSYDHLLLYSDGASENEKDKVQFDGRVAGQEHIEFLKASNYNIPTEIGNRKIYDPIQSNGLKVNVTGSGWFKIQCAAPNGPVNMKVYTQPNYGGSYISLLREFRVEPVTDGDLKQGETKETAFREYTVYLKSRGIHTGINGFWDGTTEDAGKEEIMRQSLFVVFDNISDDKFDGSYADGHPQLNIHQLSWLNEEPADYVFQREEDPKLLTEWQEIKRNDKIVLYWKACNDNDPVYRVLKENGKDTYNRLGQKVTQNLVTEGKGVQSPGGYASTSVPSDAGKYNASWDIAAPASTGSHTEAAYARGNKVIDDSSPQYVKSGANEFSIPVSGSFIRFCAMKNTYVVAHVIPGAANGDVYVLDETGAPIGFDKNTDDGKRRGYIATMLNTTDSGDEKKSGDATIRIDFCANAGKEYFICAKDASISLARLEVHDWRYNPAKAAEKLAVADNAADNGLKITAAYDAGIPYMDANLRRKVTGKWISLVLPFSMNEKKFEEVFGKGAKCIHFTDVDIPGKTVKLTHHYYNMIVAGRPVFVKPGTSPNVDVSGYLKDIEDVTLQTKTVSSYKTPDDKFEFFGSYDKTTMNRNDLFMNNNNAIKFLTDKTATYPGMRSFIKNHNGPDFSSIIDSSTPAQSKFVNFCDLDDDNVTDIEELITAEFGENVVVIKKSTKVYDLLGNPVADGSRIDNLPAGIYIVNGKKFVVK